MALGKPDCPFGYWQATVWPQLDDGPYGVFGGARSAAWHVSRPSMLVSRFTSGRRKLVGRGGLPWRMTRWRRGGARRKACRSAPFCTIGC